MQLTVLGSGGFEPGTRGSAGYALQDGKKILLIDAGRNTFNNFYKAGLKFNGIEAILLTHWHPDHASELIAFLHWAHTTRKKPLTIIGRRDTKKSVNHLLQAFSNVTTDYGLKVKEINNGVVKLAGFKIKVFEVKHKVPSIAFRIKVKGQKLVFAGDAEICPQLIIGSQMADWLVLCYHQLKAEAGRIAQNADAKTLLLSHFEPNNKMPVVRRQIKRHYKGKLILAEDLMKLKV